MKLRMFATTTACALLLAGSAMAGDAAAGEAAFNKQCVTCHVIVNDAGETLAGRNAKTGPNLYKITLRGIGRLDGFSYGTGIEALAAAEGQWTEENFVGYVQDPTGWLRDATGDNKVRGKMSYKVRSAEDAANLYAYLKTFE